MRTINLKKILIDKALVIVLLFMIIGIIIIEPSFFAMACIYRYYYPICGKK